MTHNNPRIFKTLNNSMVWYALEIVWYALTMVYYCMVCIENENDNGMHWKWQFHALVWYALPLHCLIWYTLPMVWYTLPMVCIGNEMVCISLTLYDMHWKLYGMVCLALTLSIAMEMACYALEMIWYGMVLHGLH
jgi:hypothetical protein